MDQDLLVTLGLPIIQHAVIVIQMTFRESTAFFGLAVEQCSPETTATNSGQLELDVQGRKPLAGSGAEPHARKEGLQEERERSCQTLDQNLLVTLTMSATGRIGC